MDGGGATLVLVLCLLADSADGERKVYSQVLELYGRHIPQANLWKETSVPIQDCVAACKLDSRCVSFFYNPDTEECSGSFIEVSPSDHSSEELGTKYFTITPGYGCKGFPSSQRAKFNVTSSEINSAAFYTCDSGYEDAGSGNVICQADRTWSADACQAVDCGLPDFPNNTQPTVTPVTTYTNNVTFVCNTHYNYDSGEDTITCQANGNWTTPTIVCTIPDCGSPNITGMDVSFGATVAGSTATFTCSPGYLGDGGDGTSTCQQSANWTTPALQCTIRDCGSPPMHPKASILPYTETTYGSKVSYMCNPGFIPQNADDVSITCLQQGNWEQVPSCVAAPGSLAGISFGNTGVTELTCVTRTSLPTSALQNSYIPRMECEPGEAVTSCNTQQLAYSGQYFSGFDLPTQSCLYYSPLGRSPHILKLIMSIRCCKVQNMVCETYTSTGEAKCYKDFTVVGCNGGVKSASQKYRGSNLTDDTCSAIRDDDGFGSVGITCCSAPGLTCVQRTSQPLPEGATNITMACESGETLTGCTFYTQSEYIPHQGTYFEDIGGVTYCGVIGNPGLVVILHCCKV